MKWLLVVALLPLGCSAPEREEDLSPHASGATAYEPPPPPVNPPGTLERPLVERVLAAGPGWLLQQVHLDPTFTGKHKFSGFRISSLFDNSPKVLRFGIQPGDVLRAINGQKIVTPGDLLLVFERLKTANMLEVDVTRGAEDLHFRFPILPELANLPAAPTAASR